MKSKKIIVVIDLLVYMLNGILGLFIVIFLGLTGEDCKFQDLAVHRFVIFISIIHIILSILCSILFHIKERTRFRIKIGKILMIYNLIITLAPYLYLVLVLLVL